MGDVGRYFIHVILFETMNQTLILASQSPRRKQLLEWAEIPFQVVVSNTDETYPAGLSFSEIAIHIAQQKAFAVQQQHPDHKILAADTIVVCDQQLIGKPANREEAIRFITMLSGKTHEVITGVCILDPFKSIVFSETTKVTFHPLTEAQIAFYVDRYQPYDKAGAYAIQEWIGVVGINSIEGDFYNVMGLPVSRVVQELNRF
jgi:septum formation protein